MESEDKNELETKIDGIIVYQTGFSDYLGGCAFGRASVAGFPSIPQ